MRRTNQRSWRLCQSQWKSFGSRFVGQSVDSAASSAPTLCFLARRRRSLLPSPPPPPHSRHRLHYFGRPRPRLLIDCKMTLPFFCRRRRRCPPPTPTVYFSAVEFWGRNSRNLSSSSSAAPPLVPDRRALMTALQNVISFLAFWHCRISWSPRRRRRFFSPR